MGISVGVDIGGTKILAGIVNDQGQILSKVRKKTPRADASAVLEVVGEVIAETIANVDGSIAGIGVGVAGPVDAQARPCCTPRICSGPTSLLRRYSRTLRGSRFWSKMMEVLPRGVKHVLAVERVSRTL